MVRSSFVNALCRELARRKDYAGAPVPLSTIYFGGGTPSQLTAQQMEQIFCAIRDNYIISSDAEVTMELNPDDVTDAYIRAIKASGVNRISMGVQTFSDRLLRFINRRHDARQAKAAVGIVHSAGITNVSLDLIYGLPGQTFEDWQNDVEEVLKLQPTHISAYALSYEEGTLLYERLLQGEISEADEELSLAMYQHLITRLESAGFVHYEISNFSLPGYHSRHNSSYWTASPYLGVGPGAHSFDGVSRRANLPDLQHYISALSASEAQSSSLQVQQTDAPHEVETLSLVERHNEFLMLSLRTGKGINLREMEEKFGADKLQHFLSMSQPYIEAQNLERVGDYVRLTRSGIFLSDAIISDFFEE